MTTVCNIHKSFSSSSTANLPHSVGFVVELHITYLTIYLSNPSVHHPISLCLPTYMSSTRL